MNDDAWKEKELVQGNLEKQLLSASSSLIEHVVVQRDENLKDSFVQEVNRANLAK